MFIKCLQIIHPTRIPIIQYSRYMSVCAKSLKFSQYGEPNDVLQMLEEKVESPKDKQVLVKILAAPINPADINTIQGTMFVYK